jgi:hypothetical protein
MRIDLQAIDAEIADFAPKVGDVYPAQGGKPTAIWVVVGITANVAHMLGIDKHGAVCSTTSYGVHVLESRVRIGRVELDGLSLTVQATAGMGRVFREPR